VKEQLHDLFIQAIEQLKADTVIPADHVVQLMFERPRQKEHGDFATNVAMTLAKVAKRKPRELAELIVAALPSDRLITQVDIAGPGFINMFVAQDAHLNVLNSIFEQGSAFGLAEPNSKQKIMVEFVSANPTGPLHVGHGRGAAYGDALARVLAAAGNTVEREYYVNDAGILTCQIIATKAIMLFTWGNSWPANMAQSMCLAPKRFKTLALSLKMKLP